MSPIKRFSISILLVLSSFPIAAASGQTVNRCRGKAELKGRELNFVTWFLNDFPLVNGENTTPRGDNLPAATGSQEVAETEFDEFSIHGRRTDLAGKTVNPKLTQQPAKRSRDVLGDSNVFRVPINGLLGQSRTVATHQRAKTQRLQGNNPEIRMQERVVPTTAADAAWNVGDAAWNVGDAAWNVGDAAWNVGNATWDVGDAAWDVGDAAWDVGDAAWDVGDAAWNNASTFGSGGMIPHNSVDEIRIGAKISGVPEPWNSKRSLGWDQKQIGNSVGVHGTRKNAYFRWRNLYSCVDGDDMKRLYEIDEEIDKQIAALGGHQLEITKFETPFGVNRADSEGIGIAMHPSNCLLPYAGSPSNCSMSRVEKFSDGFV